MEKKIRECYNDEILHEAMRRYGIRPDQIHLLDGFESFIYEYQCGAERRILRVTHSLHRDEAAIRGEVDWLSYLSAHGVPVACAVPSERGEWVEVLGEGPEYFSAAAFRFAEGHPPAREDWENGLMAQVGQWLGKMNSLSKHYQPGDPRARRPQMLDDLEGFERFLPPQEEAVADKFRNIIAELKTYPRDAENYGLVHQDLHGGNFFVQDGRMTLFDFDDCLYGWYAYDLAMALFYVLPHDCSREEPLGFARYAFGQLLEGYRRENELSAEWLSKIPVLLKLREIDLYIAIHRSLDVNALDPWCESFMNHRREKILGDVPYVDLDFSGFSQ